MFIIIINKRADFSKGFFFFFQILRKYKSFKTISSSQNFLPIPQVNILGSLVFFPNTEILKQNISKYQCLALLYVKQFTNVGI